MRSAWVVLVMFAFAPLWLGPATVRAQAGPSVLGRLGQLGQLGQLSLDGASLDDPRLPMPQRVAQARALGHWGDAQVAVSLLTDTLSRRPPEALRIAVLQALSERQSVQAVPELLRALRGRAGSTPWLVQALSAIGGTAVIEAMVELTQHNDRGLRDAALRVLVRIAPERVAARLLELYGGRDPGERDNVRSIAVAYPHPLWLSLLAESLGGAADPEQAAVVAWSLTRVRDGLGLPVLIAASLSADARPNPREVPLHLRLALAVCLNVHSEHLDVTEREAALALLKRGGTADEQRRMLALALGEVTGDHRPHEHGREPDLRALNERAIRLRKALHLRGDEHAEARVDAARELGELGDPKAHVPLIAALDDPSPDVRRTVVVALGRLMRPAAIAALRRHAVLELDPEVAQLTVLTLAAAPNAPQDPWFAARRLFDRPG